MNHKLILSIFLEENFLVDLKQILTEAFITELFEYNLPYTLEITEVIKNHRGFGVTYKLEIVAKTFEHAVYNLLKALQIFSIEWICSGPIIILNNKNTFTASRFKENGLFTQSYINGICAFLQEEEWET